MEAITCNDQKLQLDASQTWIESNLSGCVSKITNWKGYLVNFMKAISVRAAVLNMVN